jgi:STE24 endopeptidase
MPLTLLLALIVAFGIRPGPDPLALPPGGLSWRLLSTAGVLVLVAVVTLLFRIWLAWSTGRAGDSVPVLRRALNRGHRFLDILTLVAFALIIHGLEWPRVVNAGFGLRDTILLAEFLVLSPFLISQLTFWLLLYPLEWRLNARRHGGQEPWRPLRYLIRKARQTFGLVLPAAAIYALGFRLLGKAWPAALDSPYAQVVGVALLSATVLACAPALIRLAWPTYSLPAGSLRDRLERLSERLHFRCTDILVWDTDQNIVNAGVTGALPCFRYVLLTDALIASLDERQIEAVFGHEVGHVAHRHLAFFGFFVVGSLGILALFCKGVDSLTRLYTGPLPSAAAWGLPVVIESLVALGFLGCYFFVLFGFLSRRFERQADVYGCRAISCGRGDCPPHAEPMSSLPKSLDNANLCPVGIRIFASALALVATLNGMEPGARSWRHGSIRRRIAFLEGLEGSPEVEHRFQIGLRRLRFGLALGLLAALLAAAATGAFAQL